MKTIKSIQDINYGFLGASLEFLARHIVEGFITGLHRSPFHGFSVEFAEHRIYNSGESTRHIDWKLFARTDKLFVKKYEEETNLRCHIIIDTSTSMLFPYRDKNSCSKLEFSAYCAASLIHLLRKQRDAVGVTFFSDDVEYHSEAKLSSGHASKLYAELENLIKYADQYRFDKKNLKKTNAAASLHRIAEQIHKRSLVIIFSDMLENDNSQELFQALRHLRYKKHEVILFRVFDKKNESDFSFPDRPYRFIDLETAEELKLNPNEVKNNYITEINKYKNEIKLKCGRYNIDLIDADINADFRDVLSAYLIRRSKLY